MKTQNVKTNGTLTLRRMIDEAHDSCVRLAAHDGQLAKVLVQRDEDSAFCMGAGEELFIAGIFGQLPPRRRHVPQL